MPRWMMNRHRRQVDTVNTRCHHLSVCTSPRALPTLTELSGGGELTTRRAIQVSAIEAGFTSKETSTELGLSEKAVQPYRERKTRNWLYRVVPIVCYAPACAYMVEKSF